MQPPVPAPGAFQRRPGQPFAGHGQSKRVYGRRQTTLAEARSPCEHAFVSIKGRPGSWFEAAVRRGDLTMALSELGELPRPLAPRYALGLVVLLGEAEDPRHGRWAARWAAHVTLADAQVDLGALAELVRTLAGAPRLGKEAGREAVAALAERHGVRDASGLLIGPESDGDRRVR
jgi:hypothetical protein